MKGSLADDVYVYIPLHLSAPEDVLLLVHVDGEVLVLALLDGIRPGGDGPHLVKLAERKGSGRNISARVQTARLTHVKAAKPEIFCNTDQIDG